VGLGAIAAGLIRQPARAEAVDGEVLAEAA
jgi:hypothetical protein